METGVLQGTGLPVCNQQFAQVHILKEVFFSASGMVENPRARIPVQGLRLEVV